MSLHFSMISFSPNLVSQTPAAMVTMTATIFPYHLSELATKSMLMFSAQPLYPVLGLANVQSEKKKKKSVVN